MITKEKSVDISVPRTNAKGQVKTSRNLPRPKPPLPPMKKKHVGPLRRSSRQRKKKEAKVNINRDKVYDTSIRLLLYFINKNSIREKYTIAIHVLNLNLLLCLNTIYNLNCITFTGFYTTTYGIHIRSDKKIKIKEKAIGGFSV